MRLSCPGGAGEIGSMARILHLSRRESVAADTLGPYALETLIGEDDEIGMTAYRVTIAPGATTSVSYHRAAEELYVVLEGHGTVILDGKAHALAPGDFLRLPPGTTHGFVTAAEALVLLDVHSPGSRPDRDVFFVGETPPGFSA